MIKYYLENKEWELERASDGASGYDLRATVGVTRTLYAGQRWKVPTGLFLEMPRGCEAQVRSRSGLALNTGVIVLNAPGTIDSDYRGEVFATLLNTDRERAYDIVPGERIAQLVFAPVLPGFALLLPQLYHHPEDLIVERVHDVRELSNTRRGSGGHGSTGR